MKNYSAKLILLLITSIISPSCFVFKSWENDGVAVKSLSTIRKLQTQYASKHNGKFAPNLDELVKAENLDEHFGGEKPVVYEYIFEMKVTESTSQKPAFYSITADPQVSEGFF